MAVSQKATDDYLGRKTASHTWVKKLSDQELDSRLADAQAISGRSLWRHQKECLLVATERPTFAFFIDMGLGKTLLSIEAMEAHGVKRALVLVPFRTLVTSWNRELARWSPKLEVDVMTFSGFRNRVCNKIDGKLKLDQRLLAEEGSKYQATIIDESSLIGNKMSLIFRAAVAVSKKHRVRLALSGTPFGKDPILLWSQMHFVDRGESLGFFGMFKTTFFKEFSHWRMRFTRIEFRKDRLGDLKRLLGNSSISYKSVDCVNLPPRLRFRSRFPLPEQARDMLKLMRQELDEAAEVKTELKACFIRMLQASSGFIYSDPEEGDVRRVIDLGLQARVEATLDLVRQTDEPVIMFRTFLAVESALLAGAGKLGIRMVTDPNKWDSAQVLLLANSSGAYGGNYQRARYCIFCESPTSPIAREQAERRVWRSGQTRSVVYYDMVAEGGMDTRILQSLQSGRDLMDDILQEHRHG